MSRKSKKAKSQSRRERRKLHLETRFVVDLPTSFTVGGVADWQRRNQDRITSAFGLPRHVFYSRPLGAPYFASDDPYSIYEKYDREYGHAIREWYKRQEFIDAIPEDIKRAAVRHKGREFVPSDHVSPSLWARNRMRLQLLTYGAHNMPRPLISDGTPDHRYRK